MLLAAALDMLPMLCEKLTALNCPVPSTYQVGGSRYMFSNAFAHLSATPNAIAYGRKRSNISGDVIGIRIGDQVLRIDGVTVGSPNAQSARDLLRATGKTRRLVLRRGRDTLSVSLHLRMII